MTAPAAPAIQESWAHRVGRFVWNTTVGVVRDFMASDVKDGLIRLKGFSRAMKVVVVVASVLLVATILAYASGDILRHGHQLLVPPGGAPGRGTLVPRPLVPVTFALLAIGAALALAGALHAARPLRLAVLFLYLMVGLGIQGLAYSLRLATHSSAPLGFVCIAGVVAVFVVRWRAEPKPAAEFAMLLLLVGVGFAISQRSVVHADDFAGTAFAVNELGFVISSMLSITQPLLFVAGLDTIAFGVRTSGWLLQYVDRRIAQWAVLAGLAAISLWRGHDLVRDVANAFRHDPARSVLAGHAGAVVLIALVWGYWDVLRRSTTKAPGMTPGDDEVSTGSASVRLPLGATYGFIAVIFVPVLLVTQDLAFYGVNSLHIAHGINDIATFLDKRWFTVAYRGLVGVVLAGLGVVLTRRGGRTLPLFVGLVGVVDVYGAFLANTPGLRSFLPQAPAVDLWWVALFVGAAIWWAAHGRLTELRAERLFYLMVLAALIRQANFISNPFGPILGFAGTGFIVFGLLWGFLTAGGWTNEATPGLPRSSRVFIYLGYSLFSVALLNWVSQTHDLKTLTASANIGLDGQALLGFPLVYALFTVTFAGALIDRPIDGSEDAERIAAQLPEPEVAVH